MSAWLWAEDRRRYGDWTEVVQPDGSTAIRRDYEGAMRVRITRTEDGAAECGTWTDLQIAGVPTPYNLPREFGQADGVERAKAEADRVAREIGVAA